MSRKEEGGARSSSSCKLISVSSVTYFRRMQQQYPAPVQVLSSISVRTYYIYICKRTLKVRLFFSTFARSTFENFHPMQKKSDFSDFHGLCWGASHVVAIHVYI